MAGEWRTLLLDRLYEFSSGLSKPRSAFGSGYPFLAFKDVFYNSSVPAQLSELVRSTDQERSRCSIRRGDVFVTRTSETMDELGMSSVALRDIPDATFNGFTKRLRPRDSDTVVPEYARYYFRAPGFRQAVTAMSSLSTRASLNNEMLARLSIVLPPREEQEAIGHILGTLDDKIELNRRMSETLEVMARALFKSWFVDFDPVRAKAEGRDPGLPQPLADLFPARLVDSDLGEIPEGWEVKVLDNLSSIVLGGDWGGDEPSPDHSERTRCIRGADIPDLQAGGMGKMPFRYLKPSSLQKRVLSDGDIVVEISGGSPTQSTGRPVLVSDGLLQRVDSPLVCSNFCRFVRPIRLVYSKFLYLWLRELYSADEFFQFESGTTGIKNLAFTLFGASYKLCVPPDPVLTGFEAQVAPAFKRRQSSAAGSDTLASLRDILLPKLISGELRVKDRGEVHRRAVDG
jgi:type I restriction enzyme, S subunit